MEEQKQLFLFFYDMKYSFLFHQEVSNVNNLLAYSGLIPFVPNNKQ
jgi:hypothetical protein